MGDSSNSRSNYPIEISGWGLDNAFFTENTDLQWPSGAEKQVWMNHAIAEGSIVFVRLLSAEPSNNSVPVAYQVEQAEPMDRVGRCLLKLAQMYPRSRRSQAAQGASNPAEESQSRCGASETGMALEPEEVLR
jgi:hypothetical protein